MQATMATAGSGSPASVPVSRIRRQSVMHRNVIKRVSVNLGMYVCVYVCMYVQTEVDAQERYKESFSQSGYVCMCVCMYVCADRGRCTGTL